MSKFKLSEFIEEDLYIGRPEDREEVNKSKELLYIPVLKVKEAIKNLKKELKEMLKDELLPTEWAKSICNKTDKVFKKHIGDLK